MSRRTAEAAKAISKAWERERLLVRKGQGTRDWTKEQQQAIIEIGRAYDKDGKAFEGHHMQSVEAYPLQQGNPLNIQFLTREEHLNAHQGSFLNPTNGYYDPNTSSTESFTDTPEPCRIIHLTSPITSTKEQLAAVQEEADQRIKDVEKMFEDEERKQGKKTINSPNQTNYSTNENKKTKVIPQKKRKLWGRIKDKASELIEKTIDSAELFSKKHPLVAQILRDASDTVQTSIENKLRNQMESSYQLLTNEEKKRIFARDDETMKETSHTMEKSKAYPDNRQSPQEHEVSGYYRNINGKRVFVHSYTRGKKKVREK